MVVFVWYQHKERKMTEEHLICFGIKRSLTPLKNSSSCFMYKSYFTGNLCENISPSWTYLLAQCSQCLNTEPSTNRCFHPAHQHLNHIICIVCWWQNILFPSGKRSNQLLLPSYPSNNLQRHLKLSLKLESGKCLRPQWLLYKLLYTQTLMILITS